MSSFLESMVLAFGLNRVEARNGDDAIKRLRHLVGNYPRGSDILKIYVEFDMGWRTYSIELPADSEHYSAGDEINLSTSSVEAIANRTDLHPFPLLINQGFFPIATCAIGSGDDFVVSLADENDFILYCLYDREVAPNDPRDAREFMVKVVDLSDPKLIIREPPSEEPPPPPS